MSQMSLFDYVNGITIGSIGAELATAMPHEILDPLIAMIVYGGISILLAWITNKSRRAAGIINGRPLILLRNGKLIKKSFKKARLDVDEFVMHCRSSGYFDLSQVESVILEANGKLSIMPKSQHRPLTPQDMGINVEKATLYTAVIMDGVVDWNRLREEGLDEKTINAAVRYIHEADVLIIGGTSLAVYPAAGLIDYFQGDKLVVINKSATPRDSHADLLVQGPIGEVFHSIQNP